MRHDSGLALLALLLVAFVAMPVGAQIDEPIRVHIPFRFVAGSTVLPRGSYTLESRHPETPGQVLLLGRDQDVGVYLLGRVVANETRVVHDAVVFHTIGHQNFLSRILIKSQDCAIVLPESPTERRAKEAGEKLRETPVEAEETSG